MPEELIMSKQKLIIRKNIASVFYHIYQPLR